MDLSSRKLRSRPSIHQRSNQTDDQKQLIQNSGITMTTSTGIKRNGQTRKRKHVKTQNQENDSEDNRSITQEDDELRADSESDSEDSLGDSREKSVDSLESSREGSVPYKGECSRHYEEQSFNNSSIRNTTNIMEHGNLSKLSDSFRNQTDVAPYNVRHESQINKNVKRIFQFFMDNKYMSAFVILIVPLVITVIVTFNGDYLVEGKIDLKEVQKRFPTQDDFLWVAFKSGVNDVLTLNKPSTFILMYEEFAEETLQELLQELSKYAVCSITSCTNNPIVLTPQKLNSPEILKDYGKILEQYRNQLEEVGVMIIKNLDQVRGISAQAFHALCDEYTPLVEKSLFIFTMKVDKLPESRNKMKFIEEYFKSKWTDIKFDSLNPLITRITSMVIEVKAQM